MEYGPNPVIDAHLITVPKHRSLPGLTFCSAFPASFDPNEHDESSTPSLARSADMAQGDTFSRDVHHVDISDPSGLMSSGAHSSPGCNDELPRFPSKIWSSHDTDSNNLSIFPNFCRTPHMQADVSPRSESAITENSTISKSPELSRAYQHESPTTLYPTPSSISATPSPRTNPSTTDSTQSPPEKAASLALSAPASVVSKGSLPHPCPACNLTFRTASQ